MKTEKERTSEKKSFICKSCWQNWLHEEKWLKLKIQSRIPLKKSDIRLYQETQEYHPDLNMFQNIFFLTHYGQHSTFYKRETNSNPRKIDLD